MCLCAYIYNHNDVRIPISRIDNLVIGHGVMQAGAANGQRLMMNMQNADASVDVYIKPHIQCRSGSVCGYYKLSNEYDTSRFEFRSGFHRGDTIREGS